MRIAKIIPLLRLPPHLDLFDYEIPHSILKSISNGSLVKIPFRNRSIFGVVYTTEEKEEQQKKLKEIETVVFPYRFLTQTQLSLFNWASFHYGTPLSLLAQSFLPAIPKRSAKISSSVPIKKKNGRNTAVRRAKKPIVLRYTDINEKLNFYRECIDGLNNTNGHILFLTPTMNHALFLYRIFLEWIGKDDICLMHGTLSQGEYYKTYLSILRGEKKIVVGTRIAALAPCQQLQVIIVDDSERIEHKQYDLNPRYDSRDIALKRARLEKIQLYSVSVAPRLEEFRATQEGAWEYQGGMDTSHVIQCENLSYERKKENYTFISEMLLKKITETIEKKKNVFLFLNRKGTSRLVTCKDCEQIFLCANCALPERFSLKNSILQCPSCLQQRQLPSFCPHCRSVEFRFLGIGTEKIIDHLRKRYTTVPVMEYSSTSHVIPPQAPAIIVSTAASLHLFDAFFPPLGFMAIIIADPINNLNDFRATESEWQHCAHLAARARFYDVPLLAQAFDPSHPFVSTFLKNEYGAFAQWLMESRQRYGWPPYGRLIKFISRAEKPQSKYDSSLQTVLKKNLNIPFNLYRIRSKISLKKEVLIFRFMHSYIPGDDLPQEIRETLQILSREWLIDIDPVTL